MEIVVIRYLQGQEGRGWPSCPAMGQIWPYKKYFNELDYYVGADSHPEPDILESKVKRTLGSTIVNKTSGYNGIPEELFKTLKDEAIKVLHSVGQQIWKTQQRPQNWKRSLFILIPRKGSTKECANHWTVALISHASNIMLEIWHSRPQHYENQELPYVQTGFRKRRNQRSNCQDSLDHRES